MCWCIGSVLAWMCVRLYMCVHICGGHRSSSGSDPQKLYSFLRQGLSLSWSSPSMLSWLASEPQGQAVFASPPSSGITHLRNRLVSRRVLMELLTLHTDPSLIHLPQALDVALRANGAGGELAPVGKLLFSTSFPS